MKRYIDVDASRRAIEKREPERAAARRKNGLARQITSSIRAYIDKRRRVYGYGAGCNCDVNDNDNEACTDGTVGDDADTSQFLTHLKELLQGGWLLVNGELTRTFLDSWGVDADKAFSRDDGTDF